MPAARREHKEAVYAAEQIAGVLPIHELSVKALAETIRKLILDTIAHKLDYIPHSIENGRAVRAHFEVGLQPCAQLGIDFAVNIVGDLSPDL